MPPVGWDDEEWELGLGRCWARVLRHHVGLPGNARVVELAPGFSRKVAHGLAELDLRGEVVLVEPQDVVRARAVRRYRDLVRRAEVRGRPRLPDGPLPGRRVDALLANHAIDDLILDRGASGGSEHIFGQMRPGEACSTAFVGAWRQLLHDPYRLERTSASVVDLLVRQVVALRPTWFVANHYPSWRHDAAGLQAIHLAALAAFDDLHRKLLRLSERATSVVVSPDGGVRWLLSVDRGVPVAAATSPS